MQRAVYRLLLSVFLWGAGLSTATADFTFTSIDVPGSFSTEALDINDTGQIVGYFQDTNGAHGFLLSGGSFTSIDAPGSNLTFANSINNAGQIVGNFFDFSAFRGRGFLLSGGSFTTIDVPGSSDTRCHGINNAGKIV